MKVKRRADFDLAALYAAIDSERHARAMSWHHVAQQIGVSPSTLIGLRTRRAAEADGVLQMLLWLRRTPESFVPGHDDSAWHARIPEIRPNRVLRFDTRAIYAALDAQRASTAITWKEVARQIGGFQAVNLIRLSKGGRTAFPGVMRITRWLSLPAFSFIHVSKR